MNKPILSTEIIWGRSRKLITGSIISLLLLLCCSAPLRAGDKFDRNKLIDETIQGSIQTGDEQYRLGMYEDAVDTYLMVQKYGQFLTDQESEQLNSKIDKAQKAITGQKDALNIFWTAKELYRKNKLIDAKGEFE